MALQHGHDRSWNHDGSLTGSRFRRPEEITATRQHGQRALYLDGSRSQIDVAAAQRGQLAPPQAAEYRDQDQRLIQRTDELGQAYDIRKRQDGAKWMASRAARC